MVFLVIQDLCRASTDCRLFIQRNTLRLKDVNVNLHGPEEGGGLHALFERSNPDLGGKQWSLIIYQPDID